MATIKTILLAAAMSASAACLAGTAAAAGSFMPGGERTSQPIGHYELCQRIADECADRAAKPKPVELTRQVWGQMIDVNNTVNTMIAPRTDMEMWGKEERWSYPDREGDCEDYVLQKRRDLMSLGIPAANLLITVVRQPNGDGHAVLTVRTSRGDYVLDNLEPKVLAWTETEYTFLKRQSERNSGVWIAVNDSRAVAVGSVK